MQLSFVSKHHLASLRQKKEDLGKDFIPNCFLFAWMRQTLHYFHHTTFNRGKLFGIALKVSENPFKQNRSMLKNMTVLLYTYIFKYLLKYAKTNLFQYM